MTDFNRRFGEKLRAARKRRQLTGAELARGISVSSAAITSWETGKTYPRTNALTRLREFFRDALEEDPGASSGDIEQSQARSPASRLKEREWRGPHATFSHREAAYERFVQKTSVVELSLRYGVTTNRIYQATNVYKNVVDWADVAGELESKARKIARKLALETIEELGPIVYSSVQSTMIERVELNMSRSEDTELNCVRALDFLDIFSELVRDNSIGAIYYSVQGVRRKSKDTRVKSIFVPKSFTLVSGDA